MKKLTPNNISRKKFLKTSFLAACFLPFLQFCSKAAKSLIVKISGTNHVLGHQLWAKNFPKPTETSKHKFIIVGAGISGLSAARILKKNGIEDFLVLEMENHFGGNSSNGENKYSKFPLGAHYLPIPNKADEELKNFLKESNIYLKDDENGEPIFDEYQVTYAPEERLFYKNEWQENLIPQYATPEKVKSEFQRFFQLMDDFRKKKDTAGKFWFDIPIKNASTMDEVKNLEKITFKSWLLEHQFHSDELFWYLDYCCKDDFGLGTDFVSAWAGIFYFSARKNDWSKKYNGHVFTWAEGNARLAKHLAKFSEGKIIKNHLTYDCKVNENDEVEVLVFDNVSKKSKKIIAEKVLFSTPQFVNQYLFPERKKATESLVYAPWLLATFQMNENFGAEEELNWDNVIYGVEGLGYIYNQHQNTDFNSSKKIITYYRSFSSENSKQARRNLYKMTDVEMKNLVFEELKLAHPHFEEMVEEVYFHKLGHGMITPVPNTIFGEKKAFLKKDIDNKIFFAHTDLSGISIFEEAFHQGIDAAKKMLQ